MFVLKVVPVTKKKESISNGKKFSCDGKYH